MHDSKIKDSGRIAEQPGNVTAPVRFLPNIQQGQPEGGRVGVSHLALEGFVSVGPQLFVGVKNQHPISCGLLKRGIAGGTKVITPREGINLGAMVAGDLERPIGRTRIHDHKLIGDRANRSKAAIKELLLVSSDEANG
jgi:hypothetical protein